MITLRVADDRPPAHLMLFRIGEAISGIARLGIAAGFLMLIAPGIWRLGFHLGWAPADSAPAGDLGAWLTTAAAGATPLRPWGVFWGAAGFLAASHVVQWFALARHRTYGGSPN